jgi:hypothetical protein
MRVVNVQLREQAEAAIKDKVATMGIDEVLSDKQPIIEELTARLRSVAEGEGGSDKGLGLRIVAVQIKEAVVSSKRVWENLQKPPLERSSPRGSMIRPRARVSSGVHRAAEQRRYWRAGCLRRLRAGSRSSGCLSTGLRAWAPSGRRSRCSRPRSTPSSPAFAARATPTRSGDGVRVPWNTTASLPRASRIFWS